MHPAVSATKTIIKTLATNQPVAVVLGGGRTGLGVVRSLAHAGLNSIVVSEVNNRDDVATVSRFAQNFSVNTFEGEEFIEALLHLQAKISRSCVLLFSDDRPLITVSRFRDQFAGDFSIQLPPHERLVQLALKQPFFDVAQQGGFPVPTTLLLRSQSDLRHINDIRAPLCVKPNGRSLAYDSAFKKAYRAVTHADAIALCERIIAATGEVIVQEWIEGANDAIYFTLCCMGHPEPVAFTGRKGRSWPPQVGFTASCWAAPEVSEELESLTTRFFHYIGVESGLASMEFRRDRRDGQFFMIEPTIGRADLQEELSALCGVNLPYVAYCDAAGLQRPALGLEPIHVWRDEFRDRIAARILGTKCSYPPNHHIHNAYWRWDDPAPAIRAMKGYIKSIYRRKGTDVLGSA